MDSDHVVHARLNSLPQFRVLQAGCRREITRWMSYSWTFQKIVIKSPPVSTPQTRVLWDPRANSPVDQVFSAQKAFSF